MSLETRPVLVAGCGYVGAALAARLAQAGREVWGLKRSEGELPRGVRPIFADAASGDLGELSGRTFDLCYLISPSRREQAAYREAYLEGLAGLARALRIGRLLFASSTAVYGDSAGRWIDEETVCVPDGFAGQVLLEAEELAFELAERAVVVRLGGIYGPGRDRMARAIGEGRAIAPAGEARYGNRIHRDDAAGVFDHLLHLEDPAARYLGVDDDPADLREVQQWLCQGLGRDPATLEPAPRTLRRGNKRARNERLRQSGFAFSYPSFREGYEALLADLR